MIRSVAFHTTMSPLFEHSFFKINKPQNCPEDMLGSKFNDVFQCNTCRLFSPLPCDRKYYIQPRLWFCGQPETGSATSIKISPGLQRTHSMHLGRQVNQFSASVGQGTRKCFWHKWNSWPTFFLFLLQIFAFCNVSDFSELFCLFWAHQSPSINKLFFQVTVNTEEVMLYASCPSLWVVTAQNLIGRQPERLQPAAERSTAIWLPPLQLHVTSAGYVLKLIFSRVSRKSKTLGGTEQSWGLF